MQRRATARGSAGRPDPSDRMRASQPSRVAGRNPNDGSLLPSQGAPARADRPRGRDLGPGPPERAWAEPQRSPRRRRVPGRRWRAALRRRGRRPGTDRTLRRRGSLAVGLSVDNAEDGKVLRATVQIGPGRYVLAGIRRASNGLSGIVALRYDLDASGGRVVWQRRLVARNDADVLAAVTSGDRGLVLGASAAEGGAPNRAPSCASSTATAGTVACRAAGARQRLQRMPDGGCAALSFARLDARPRVTRLSTAAPCYGGTACRWTTWVPPSSASHPPPTAA